jgi:hypothetical protein
MSRILPFIAIFAFTFGVVLGTPMRAQQQPSEAPSQGPSQETTSETSPQAQELPRVEPQQVRPQEVQPQQAQPQPPESGDSRFAFHRIDNGFLRLDLRTGAVAACSQQPAGWTCVLAPEERAAFDSEIARLQRENAVLKNAMLELGLPLPKGVMPEATPPSAAAPSPQVESIPRPPQSVPPVASAPPGLSREPRSAEPKPGEGDRAARDDAELDRVMTMMEKVWRRLVEMMMSIQREAQKKG